MPTPQEFIDEIITNALATANDATEDIEDAADSLARESVGAYWPLPPYDPVFEVTAVEPDVPEVEDQHFLYRDELDNLLDELADQLAQFFASYYPLASDAFDEATTWLINTITSGGTGIPAAIEDQIWQRARERIVTEGLSQEDAITNGYANKGYSLPPGAMTKKIEQIRMARLGTSGEQSTSIAVKQAEIEIENIRFAVEKAIESRTMAMTAASDYIRAVAGTMDSAMKVVDLEADAQAKMLAASADFYRARLSRDELILKGSSTKVGYGMEQWKDIRTTTVDADQVKVQALSASADALGKVAQAALTSLNTVASTATNAFS